MKSVLLTLAAIILGFAAAIFIYVFATRPPAPEPVPQAPSEFTSFTTRDGIKLYYQEIQPQTPSKAMVVFLQGVNGGGYRSVLNDKLAAAGVYSYIIHQRGTGYSEGVRGDLSTFDLVTDDYRQFIALLTQRHPNLPIFVLGHSLGGTFCIEVASQLSQQLAGTILINPATRFRQQSYGFLQSAQFMINYVLRPGAPVISAVPKNVRYDKDRKEVELLTRDPLALKRVSPRYAIASTRLMDKAVADARNATSPLLLIFGARDEVIDHSVTQRMFADWKGPDKTQIIIEDAGHGGNIFDGSNDQIVDWIVTRCYGT